MTTATPTKKTPYSSPIPGTIPTAPVSIQTVDANTAQDWLDNHNNRNRTIRHAVIDRYYHDMVNDNWKFNGESIQFDTNHTHMNGQHRLKAIVRSGRPQQFVIVTGLDPDAHCTIDNGAKRTPGDVLTLSGYREGRTLAAVANFALTLEALAPGSPLRVNRTRTTADVEDRVRTDPHLQKVVETIIPEMAPPKALMTRAVAAYTYYALSKVHPADAAKFFDSLLTLANLPQGSPIIALHRRLTAHTAEHIPGQNGAFRAIAYVIHAWNAWRAGEERQMVKRPASADGLIRMPQPQ